MVESKRLLEVNRNALSIKAAELEEKFALLKARYDELHAAVKAIQIPTVAALVAIDDNRMSGRRSLPITGSIGEWRRIRLALDTPPSESV